MFFFIGGVQPKTVTLDRTPRRCDACGLFQLKAMRTDHYLSLFFIPIIPIKKGDVYYRCQSCGSISAGGTGSQDVLQMATCPKCGRQVERDFQFCPFCGSRLPG